MCCLLVFHTLCHRLARAVKRPTLCAAARLRDPALRVAHSAAVALTAMRTDTCAAALEANVGLFTMGTPQSDLALTAALSALRPLQAVGTTQSDLALSAALHTLRALFVVRAASRGLRGQHQQHFVEAMRLKFYALGDGLRPYINVVLTPPRRARNTVTVRDLLKARELRRELRRRRRLHVWRVSRTARPLHGDSDCDGNGVARACK